MFNLKNKNTKKRLSAFLVALQLLGLASVLAPQRASAAQITARSLNISDSTPSKTNVTYFFTLTPASTANAGAIGFEFCTQDPLSGTTCTSPSGLSTTSAALSAQTGNTGFTIVNTTQGYPYLTRSASAMTAVASTYTLTGITNPSGSNVTYYLRMLIFSGTAPSPVNSTSDSSSTDFGGLAWSTTNPIVVTAKVQESLSFCTYVTGTCASPTGSTVDLGVLSTIQSTAAFSKFEIGTNAQNGCLVQYFGATLTSGANTIAAATAVTAPAGGNTEFFGLNLASTNGNLKTPAGGAYSSSAAPTGSAPIASVNTTPTDYNTANIFNFVVSASAPTNASPTSKNSQSVAFSTSQVNQTVFTVNYGAGITATTKPGVYTTTVQYVGTGFF